MSKYEHPTRQGAAVGLGWGLSAGVVAALFPPVGIGLVGTTAGGTALGALLGHAGERMDRADVDELGETLEQGQAGVVAVYDADLADRVADEMRGARRIVSKTTGLATGDLRDVEQVGPYNELVALGGDANKIPYFYDGTQLIEGVEAVVAHLETFA